MDIILIIAEGQVLLFIVLLLTKKPVRLSNWLLILFFSLIGINLAALTTIAQSDATLPACKKYFLELSQAVVFLETLALWYYTKSLTRPDFRLQPTDVLHLIPFVLNLIIIIVSPTWLVQHREIQVAFLYGVILFYGMDSLKILKQYQQQLVQQFSNLHHKELTWLKLLIQSILLLCLISICSQFLQWIFAIRIPMYGGLFLNISLVLFIFVLGYFGLTRTSVFIASHSETLSNPSQAFAAEAPVVLSGKQIRPGISQEQIYLWRQQLTALMEQAKIYQQPELTLLELAEKMNISTHQLSFVLNQELNQNFYEYVNSFRVREVISLINQGELTNKTLLALALDSGFNSKASFNRAFKKHIGQTPSEFIKNSQPDSIS